MFSRVLTLAVCALAVVVHAAPSFQTPMGVPAVSFNLNVNVNIPSIAAAVPAVPPGKYNIVNHASKHLLRGRLDKTGTDSVFDGPAEEGSYAVWRVVPVRGTDKVNIYMVGLPTVVVDSDSNKEIALGSVTTSPASYTIKPVDIGEGGVLLFTIGFQDKVWTLANATAKVSSVTIEDLSEEGKDEGLWEFVRV
ncbi:hypothetical protein MVEN_02166400 [Mycena venus]|uniref:Uncharacterized protein n=1 Tax=Mycena venus TaxID=2733690 RepID=A0A8H6X839_9AGAR|nr:hypothetical protein MVEN_02166400 [Mycena venus]